MSPRTVLHQPPSHCPVPSIPSHWSLLSTIFSLIPWLHLTLEGPQTLSDGQVQMSPLRREMGSEVQEPLESAVVRLALS